MGNPPLKPDEEPKGSERRLLSSGVRFALIPVLLIGLTASVIHAGSEAGVIPLAAATSLTSELNAETRTRLVDAAYRAELAKDAQNNSELEKVSSEIFENAKQVYRSKPLDPRMIRILATGHVAFEDPERAFEIVKLLRVLNRRDPIANMWLIQEYGKREEIVPMLAIFDQTMRTNREVRTTTMPAFVNLLTFPEGRTAIRDMLALQPDWEGEFWTEFARNPGALGSAEAFFGPDGYDLASLDEEYRRPIFQALKNIGMYDALFRLAEASSSEAASYSSSKRNFSRSESGDPFGWEITSTGKYVTMVDRADGVLNIDAEPGSFGSVAERLVRTPTGGQLVVRLTRPLEDGVRFEGRLICADETSATIGRAILVEGESEASAQIVEASCSFATLAMVISVGGRRQSATIQVESAYFQP